MGRTCPNCGKAFAHSSSLSRHHKVCGGGTPRLPCPHCSETFTRTDDLKRHVGRYCKGTKRPAEQTLPEKPKRPLVDYRSSESEPEEEQPPQSWRVAEESSSDEETVPEPAESDEEPWHAEVDEPIVEEESIGEEVPPVEEDTAEALSLEQIKEALPWAAYQGMFEEQFSAATQQIGGNPLFHFEFSPVSHKQWMRRVKKTVYSTRLKQKRLPKESDDVGVAIVNALEASTRQHLTKIGASEEDRVFLAITAQDFAHIYQTTEFTVREFMAGSTRLD